MRFKDSVPYIGAIALAGGAVIYYRHFFPPTSSGASPAMHVASTQDAPVQLWHCGMHPQVIQDHPGFCPICHMPLTPLNAAQHTHGQVTVDPAIVQNMGVRTAVATRGSLTVTVKATGILKIPDPSVYEIAPKTTGWITKLYADTEGMHVHKGDVLFDYYSPDLEEAATELIQSVRALQSPASDMQRHDAQSQVDGARQRLMVRDVSPEDVDAIAKMEHAPASVPIRSPADGEVMEKMVVQGASVTAGNKVMRIEGHGKLWLDAEVYENQLQQIAVGEPVTATFGALPGQMFDGKVCLVFPHIDATSRTEIVRTLIESPELALKPGMYATVNILTKPVENAMLIPREAVIDSGTKQVVFVATGDGHFDAKTVHAGIVGDDDQVQILDGINEGDAVVTSGQFLLDVESRTVEAIDKLRHGDAMPRQMPGMKGGMK